VVAVRSSLLAVGLALIAAACGSSAKQPSAAELAKGKQVFQSAGCGRCHSLKAAGATGIVGGSLDNQKLKVDFVDQKVRFGGGGMPQFQHKLSDAEIKAVAAFVSKASGR
jgi:sulfite dehydrogenase